MAHLLLKEKSDKKWEKYINMLENGEYVQTVSDLLLKVESDSSLIVAIACLKLYLQANYTGPKISTEKEKELERVFREYTKDEMSDIHNDSLIQLMVEGDVPHTQCEIPYMLLVARKLLSLEEDSSLKYWWQARSVVVHERLLMHEEPSMVLYEEMDHCWEKVRSSEMFQGLTESQVAEFWVERGLGEHFFEHVQVAKMYFEKGKGASGLEVQVTGAMGKRTKFQYKDVAQMVVLAKSKNAKDGVHGEGKKGRKVEEEEVQDLIQTGEGAFRTISLEQANPDNILLETVEFEKEEAMATCNLSVVDQTILLALCLDVSNSNPKDGLTSEQMFPYVARVLHNPNNWMVHSTALLEKAWLECTRSHSRERAVLQVQALVDQHTTRLTIMQSSITAIENAAPAEERLLHIFSLVFPPQYQLKRDLADRYFKLGVLQSALEIYQELEMWDEIVQCYKLLDKPKNAEALVRKRLEICPTPFMWCCLGDITQDPAFFEKAWTLSNNRFARAKRSLGRYYFEKGDLEACITHLQDSVQVRPQNVQAWFLLGVASMRIQKWSTALTALTRVVQLEPGNGEAWGNLGSVQYRNENYDAAFSAFQEGLKVKRTMWQMWENFSLCAMEIKKYGDAMYAMHQLLDMRDKHKRPIDHEILAWLVEAIVFDNQDMEHGGEPLCEEDIQISKKSPLAVSNDHYKKQLALLLGRISTIVTNDPKIWQVYARFNDGVGRPSKALDARLKECRALQSSGWDRDESRTNKVVKSCIRLAEDYRKSTSTGSLYACKMFLRPIIAKVTTSMPDYKAIQRLQIILDEVVAEMAESK